MKYSIKTFEKSIYLEICTYTVEANSKEEAEQKVKDLEYLDSEIKEQYYESGELEDIVEIVEMKE
jgi:predicted nucleotidyltransferase